MKNKNQDLIGSRTCLGTVQLGLKYGINNKTGKPSTEESIKILEEAYKSGIRTFDTAYAYGNAEEVIGGFLSKTGVRKNIQIISKLKPNVLEEYNGRDPLDSFLEKRLNESLNRLKTEYLDGYLFHTPGYIYNSPLVDAMKHLREKGLVKNIGVSIYDVEDAISAVNSGWVDYIEVPYSILDQRIDKSNFFGLAKDKKITIFARSPFVQGLILMNPEEIPLHLKSAGKYLEKINKIANAGDVSVLESSLLFPYSNPHVDYVLFGVDNLSQLKEDLEIILKSKNVRSITKSMKKEFKNINDPIVIPSLWKKD